MKSFFVFLSTILIPAMLISAFVFRDPKNEVSEKHVELVMRNIGHQLLLHTNDSTKSASLMEDPKTMLNWRVK